VLCVRKSLTIKRERDDVINRQEIAEMWNILVPIALALLVALLGARWGLQKLLDSAYEN
jgi:hypothetical protein